MSSVARSLCPSRTENFARPAFVIFTVVFFATAIWSFTRPNIYEATTELHVSNYFPIYVYHEEPTVETTTIRSSFVSGETFKKLVESNHVLRRVPPHLPPHVRDRLTSAEPEDYLQKLRATREATPERQGRGLLIHIVCRHREPDVAADLANAFAAATEEYFTSRQQEEERYALAYLAEASDKARREAEATAAELAHPGLPEDRRQKLETALKSQRFIAEQIAQRLAEVRTGGSTSTHTLRITPATTPGVSDYSSPNHSLDLSIGLLVGALAAGANTLIRRRSDPR